MKWQLEEVTSGKTKVLMIAQGKKVEGRKGSQKAWDTDLEVATMHAVSLAPVPNSSLNPSSPSSFSDQPPVQPYQSPANKHATCRPRPTLLITVRDRPSARSPVRNPRCHYETLHLAASTKQRARPATSSNSDVRIAS